MDLAWTSWGARDLLVAGSTFLVAVCVWMAGILLWARHRGRAERALRERLGGPSGSSDGARRNTLRLWHDGRMATTLVAGGERRPSLVERLEHARLEAGFTTPLSGLALLGVSLCLASGLVLFLATRRPAPAVIGTLSVPAVMTWYVHQRLVKRRRTFDRQLIDALELSARALAAGHPLHASFQLISEEIPAPVGTVFSEICQQQALGVPLDESLRRAGRVSQSADLKLFATALSINLRSGGSLADTMRGLAKVIRERIRLGRRFRVLVAQTQVSKRILLAMPIVMFAVLNLISPEYMATLYSTPLGNVLMIAAGGSMLLGWLVMSRMAELET